MRHCPVCGEDHASCGAYRLKYKPVGFEGIFIPAEDEEMPIVTVPSRGVKAEDYFTSDRRLYLDAEGGVVEVDNKSRKTLLVGKNGQIPMARARELGLVEGEAPSGAEVSTSAAEPSTPETREAAKPEGESQAKSSKKTASKKSK